MNNITIIPIFTPFEITSVADIFLYFLGWIIGFGLVYLIFEIKWSGMCFLSKCLFYSCTRKKFKVGEIVLMKRGDSKISVKITRCGSFFYECRHEYKAQSDTPVLDNIRIKNGTFQECIHSVSYDVPNFEISKTS